MPGVRRREGRIWMLWGRTARLAIASAATLFALLGASPGLASADQPAGSAPGGETPPGQPMPPGFVGISFEYKAMHVYTGRDPRVVNPVLVQLLRGINPQQAPVLRIGGNSTDQTWWPVPGGIPPG